MRMGAEILALYACLFASVIAIDQRWDIGFAYPIMGFLFAGVLEFCGRQIAAYRPISKLDAKISNEKIKLWIMTVNTIAGSLLIAGIALPAVSALTDPSNSGSLLPIEHWGSFLLVISGIYVHIQARNVFNLLKDEDLAATVS
jgi:hypothetical protein